MSILQGPLVKDQHDVGLGDDGALHRVGDDDVAHRPAAALLLTVKGNESHVVAGLNGGVAQGLTQGDDTLPADAGEQKFIFHCAAASSLVSFKTPRG